MINHVLEQQDLETDDELDSVNMIEEEEEMCFESEEKIIFIDSAASNELFIVIDGECLQAIRKRKGSIGLTERGQSMESTRKGDTGDWKEITVCARSRRNICSVKRPQSMGYGFEAMRETNIVKLSDREIVLKCGIAQGIPYVKLDEPTRYIPN